MITGREAKQGWRPSGQHLAGGWIAAICCALLGLVVFVSPAGRHIEQAWGLHWLFTLRGPLPPPTSVAVVSLDRESADHLGFRQRPEYWDRSHHALLIERLRGAGASAIVFDLWFGRPSRAEADRSLQLAMRRAGNVLLLERLAQRDDLPLGTLYLRQRPYTSFSEAALATGPFTLPKVPVAVSHFWMFDANAGDAPSLAVLAALAAQPEAHRRWVTSLSIELGGDLPGEVARHDLQAQVATLRSRLLADCSGGMHDCGKPGTNKDAAGGRITGFYLGPASRVLNLYGPPQTVRTLPYWQVVADEAPLASSQLAQHVSGRVVFVGVSSSNQPDQDDAFITPYSDPVTGHDVAGVELLATATANLLQDESIRVPSATIQLSMVLGIGLVVGFATRLLPTWLAITGTGLLAAAWFAAAYQAFASHYWLPTATPITVQMPLALLFGLWRQSVAARRARSQLGAAVARYLPAHVVDRLATRGFDPAKDRQAVQGVCLNTDVERYTDLAESLAPEALVKCMNTYYQRLFEPVTRHHGMVSDVVGDAMLAVWAQNHDSLELRRDACLAALDILKRQDGGPDAGLLRTRIGIHAGDMVLTHLGADSHFEYRAVGDTVNTSERLQSFNKVLGTRCLVSAETLAGLEDIPARRIGCFRLKGKQRPISVYALCLPSSDAFEDALQRFQACDWKEAHDCFAALAQACPEDSAVSFYLRLTEEAQRGDRPTRDWAAVTGID